VSALRGAARLAVALAVLGTTACASSARRDADRRLASGDAAGAAAAYDALLQSPPGAGEDLLLFQAATAHALAGLDAGDPARGSATLEALVSRFPESPYRPAAQLLLRLQDRLAAPSPSVAGAPAAGASLAATGGTDALGELRQTLVDLHRQVDRLVAEAREREAKLRALRDEVEMLKAIDLGPPAEPPH